MPPVDRFSKDDGRQRRAFQRFVDGIFAFGAGLIFDKDKQEVSIDIKTDGGLEFDTEQLAVKAGSGIVIDSAGVNADLLANGGLEFDGGSNELSLADSIDLTTVGVSGVLTFASASASHGIISGVSFTGNDSTTATTAVWGHTSHLATPAIAQDSDGEVFIESASGQQVNILPQGAAGTYIGQSSALSGISAAGAGSTIIGGVDLTGTLSATGQNDVVVGAATAGGSISSTASFFSFAIGFATASGTITATNFASLAYGLCLGGSASITSSGFGSVAGGLAGAGFSNVMVGSGSGSICWGGGHTNAGAAAALFGKDNTTTASGVSAFGGGEDHLLSATAASALGTAGTVSGANGCSIGNTNTVSGAAAVALGTSQTASAQSAVAAGQEADARLHGGLFQSGANHSANGDAQQGVLSATLRTTNASISTMFLDGSSARLLLQNHSTVAFTILVTAKEEASGGERAAYRVEGSASKDATSGSTAVAGVATTTLQETNAGMNATVTADTTNGGISIRVTGVAATNIRWHASIRLSEVVGS